MTETNRIMAPASAELTTGSAAWRQLIIDGAGQLNIPVHPEHVNQFAVHAQALDLWNRKMNLTAIKTPLQVAVKHYLDSIVPAAFIKPDSALLDVGSGAGFPGIPLKIVQPSLSVTLIDASRKKVGFLKHVIRALQLDGMRACHVRIEALAGDRSFQQAFDTIICRAFSSLAKFTSRALPLLKPTGVLISLKGTDIEAELKEIGGRRRGESCIKWALKGEAPVFFKLNIYKCVLPYLNLERELVVLTRVHLN